MVDTDDRYARWHRRGYLLGLRSEQRSELQIRRAVRGVYQLALTAPEVDAGLCGFLDAVADAGREPYFYTGTAQGAGWQVRADEDAYYAARLDCLALEGRWPEHTLDAIGQAQVLLIEHGLMEFADAEDATPEASVNGHHATG
jgi:hypothetical protein